MHADEVATDAGLVRRLIAAQFPRWAEPARRAGAVRRNRQCALSARRRHGGAHAAHPLGDRTDRDGAPLAAASRPAPAAGDSRRRWRSASRRRGSLGRGPSIAGSTATTPPSTGSPIPIRRRAIWRGFVHALQAIDTTGGPQTRARHARPRRAAGERDAETREAIASLRRPDRHERGDGGVGGGACRAGLAGAAGLAPWRPAVRQPAGRATGGCPR